MGCKSPVACNDNKSQNFKGKWAERQCKPWGWFKRGPSVCRQCCNNSDSCAKDFVDENDGQGTFTVNGWNNNLLV